MKLDEVKELIMSNQQKRRNHMPLLVDAARNRISARICVIDHRRTVRYNYSMQYRLGLTE